jgi:hypothetical protein
LANKEKDAICGFTVTLSTILLKKFKMNTFRQYKKSVLKQFYLMEEIKKTWADEESISNNPEKWNYNPEELDQQLEALKKKRMDLFWEREKLSDDQKIYIEKKKEQNKRRQEKYEPYEDSVASRTRNNAGHCKMSDKICVHFKKPRFMSIYVLN